MSSQIDVARVLAFKNNLFHQVQQKGSRLRPAVRNEMQVGKAGFYERLGAATAIAKTSRHMDTPQIDSVHSRRMVTMADYIWADMIDQEDKIRMLIDPTSEYVQSAAFSLGRKMDDVILAAAVGNAYSGETGATTVALSTSQKVVPVSGGAATNLNVASLILAKQILDQSDVDPSIPRYLALNASALASLLNSTQVTSSDYNTVKALVQGEVDTFLGFKFIRTERVNQNSTLSFLYSTSTGLYNGSGSNTTALTTPRSMVAWAGDGMLMAMGKDITTKIDVLPGKSYATQVFASASFAATRLEEEKVVEIICSQ